MIIDDDEKSAELTVFDVSKCDIKQKVTVDECGVDDEKISAAQDVIKEMIETYYERATQDVKTLQLSFLDLANNLDDYEVKIRALYKVAHDMKGQGASFDYHMVTYVGDYLCRFLDRIKAKPTKKILEVVNIHIQAMNIIITNKIRGKVNSQGDEILNGLEMTLQKYAPDIVQALHSFRKKEEMCELGIKEK